MLRRKNQLSVDENIWKALFVFENIEARWAASTGPAFENGGWGGFGVLGLAAEDQALGRRMTLDVCDSLSLEGSTRKCFLFQKLTIGSLRPPLASSTLMYHYEAACSPR